MYVLVLGVAYPIDTPIRERGARAAVKHAWLPSVDVYDHAGNLTGQQLYAAPLELGDQIETRNIWPRDANSWGVIIGLDADVAKVAWKNGTITKVPVTSLQLSSWR